MHIIEERAKKLKLKEKEIYDGYKDLEVKKMEVAEKSEKANGISFVSLNLFLVDGFVFVVTLH